MTKELVISVIIVVVIIAGDVFTTKYTNKSIEIATQSLSEIGKEMQKENEEDINKDKLKEQIKEIRDDWNERHKKLAIYIEHDELEKIETNLASLNGYLDMEMEILWLNLRLVCMCLNILKIRQHWVW